MSLMAIRARRRGPCGLCEALIEVDDPIVEVEGEWCHATCAEDEGYDVMEPLE